MEKIINLGIPHVGELIFKSIDTDGMVEYCKVSQTWKVLAENVLFKRWRERIFEACISGKVEVMKILLERLDYENNEWNVSRDDYGYTPYMVACVLGHENLVELFLEHYLDRNIDLNAKDKNGQNGFMAACNEGHANIVKLLLDHADQTIEFNYRDNHGQTALMLACNEGHKDIVQLLLENSDGKIEINEVDDDGETALMKAC